MRTALLRFLATPERADDVVLRLAAAGLLAAGGVFFFRLEALPVLAACLGGGLVAAALLWAGYHRLGIRALGRYQPGFLACVATALLVFCLMPPHVPVALAAGLAVFGIVVEAAERRALVPLALGGAALAWFVGSTWQSNAGVPFLSPFDLHPLDEPVALWARFEAAIDPVRTYAGQVPGPLGATSFGLVALVVLLLGFARRVAWPLVGAFYLPIALFVVFTGRPAHVYLLDAPALLFSAVIAANRGRLPPAPTWQSAAGLLAGVLAVILLVSGSGYQAFGIGVVVSTALVTVFQYFRLADTPEVLAAPAEPPVEIPVARPGPAARAGRGRAALEVLTLAVFMPAGLALVLRDGTLERSQRRALVTLGLVLYVAALAGSLAWLWFFRLPT